MYYKESKTLGLKSSFSDWKEIIMSLGAFANKKGGLLVIGANDDSQPTNLVIGKKSIEDLVNKIKNNTDKK